MLKLNDNLLEEYLALDAKIKELEQRHSEIKAFLLETGTVSTQNHVCIIAESRRTIMCGVGKCVEALGETLLKRHDLIELITYSTVKVHKKAKVQRTESDKLI